MTSPTAQSLLDDYRTNTGLIHRIVDGVSDEESLLQPPFPANCLNWVWAILCGAEIRPSRR